jgi:Putative zinc-finger
MTCKQTTDLVTDYLEGCLTPERQQEVEQHLASCNDCPTYFTQMRQFLNALPLAKERAGPVEVPPVILEAFLTGKLPRSARRPGGPQIVVISAAVVITILAMVWVWNRLNPHRGVRPGNSPSDSYQAATLDLRKWSVLRGENNPPNSPLQLPRKPLALSILLPVGREPGAYEVTVSRTPGQPLTSVGSNGQFEDHITVLHAKIDLTALPSGTYQLGVRQQGWDWTYYPLVLR